LARQYNKRTNDDEERRIQAMMNKYLPDGDMFTEKSIDRSFRDRMRTDKDVDWSKILGNLEDNVIDIDGDQNEEDVQAFQIRERKIEMLKWKLDQEQKVDFSI